MNKFALSAITLAVSLAFPGTALASFEQNGSPRYVFQVQYAAFAKPTKQALRELIPNVFEVYIHKEANLPESMSWHAGQDWVSIAKQLTWSGDLQLRIDWQELAVYIRPANLSFEQSLKPTEAISVENQGQITLEAKVSISGEPEIIETASVTFDIPEKQNTEPELEAKNSADTPPENNPEIILNDTIEVETLETSNTLEGAEQPLSLSTPTESNPMISGDGSTVPAEAEFLTNKDLTDFEKQAIAQYEASLEEKRLTQEIEISQRIANELADEFGHTSTLVEPSEESPAVGISSSTSTEISETVLLQVPSDALKENTIQTTEYPENASEIPEVIKVLDSSITDAGDGFNPEEYMESSIQILEPMEPIDTPEPLENPIVAFFEKLFGSKAVNKAPLEVAPLPSETPQELLYPEVNTTVLDRSEPLSGSSQVLVSSEAVAINEITDLESKPTFESSEPVKESIEAVPATSLERMEESSELLEDKLLDNANKESSSIVFVFEENTNLRTALTDLVKQEGWNLVWKAPEAKNVISNYFVSYEAQDLKSLLKLVLPTFGLKAERYVPNKVIVIK